MRKKKKRSEGRRKKWNRPTIKMLLKELKHTSNPIQRAVIERKIEAIRAWCKTNPETVTFYPNRCKE